MFADIDFNDPLVQKMLAKMYLYLINSEEKEENHDEDSSNSSESKHAKTSE